MTMRHIAASIACVVSTWATLLAGPAAETPSARWDAVLELAKSKVPGSHSELETLAKADDPVALLAKRMLGEWDSARATYNTDRPVPVRDYCPDTERLREAFPRTVDPAFALVAVDVTTRGFASAVAVIRTSDKFFGDLVLDAFRDSRFLPAKPDDDFVASRYTVLCRMDVR